MDVEKIAEQNLIWRVVSGSRAYKTCTLTSDEDIRGIFILPRDLVINPFVNVEQVMDKTNDVQIYELQKFLLLLVDNNPNIMELLWVPDRCVQYKHPIMQRLLESRDLFLSKKCRHTFSGYAMAQLKRIKSHEKWINNPQPEEPPRLMDFVRVVDAKTGFEVTDGSLLRATATKVNEHVYKLWYDFTGQFGKTFFEYPDQDQPNYIDIDMKKIKAAGSTLEFCGFAFVNLEEFKRQHTDWKQYWEWKKNRNEARAVLEEKYNYDTKHAMHLVRLLRMGVEILSEGQVLVERPDAEELMDIRNGKWTYDEVTEYATMMDAKMGEMYEKSSLPRAVDRDVVAKIYVNMLNEWG